MVHTEEVERKIKSLNQLIEIYKEQFQSIQDEITEYQDGYDYEADPEGIDYDLGYIHQQTIDCEAIEQSIKNVEEEIEELQKN